MNWEIKDSVLYTINIDEKRNKVAAFDLDYTLIETKSGNVFPQTKDDWQLLDWKLMDKLEELDQLGYNIVIFSNQKTTPKLYNRVKRKINDIIDDYFPTLRISAYIMTGDDQYRKPNTSAWNLFKSKVGDIDYNKTFYVGDAAGREMDFADSDKKFAENIGIKFFTPEAFLKING